MELEELFQRGLSLDKLRSFLAVVRAGSVTAAAGGLASRRSLMSRQVSELEATLGIELFNRKGKSLNLTDTGRTLALLTATYFTEFDNLVRRATGEHSTMRIGAGSSIFEAVVFPGIREVQRGLRDFRFEFVTDSTTGILRSLQEGGLDLGIIRKGEHGPDVIPIPCGSMDFVLVGRVDFDRNLPQWGLGQFLTRVPLAMIRGSGRFVSTFQQLCRDSDADPQVTIRAESFGQVRQLIQSGHPGGILPRQLIGGLATSEFHVLEDPELGKLSSELAVVIDSRVARVRDGLSKIAGDLARVLKGHS